MSMYSNRLQPALQMLFSERPPIYASCMTISGGTTEQHIIIARFLPHHWLYAYERFSQFQYSCEHIRFFHGALQLFHHLYLHLATNPYLSILSYMIKDIHSLKLNLKFKIHPLKLNLKFKIKIDLYKLCVRSFMILRQQDLAPEIGI